MAATATFPSDRLLRIVSDGRLWPQLRQEWLMAVASNRDLPGRATQIAFLLVDLINRDERNARKGIAWPRAATLAERAGGLCERTVRSVLSALIDAGYLRQKRRRGAAFYTIPDAFVRDWEARRERQEPASQDRQEPSALDRQEPSALNLQNRSSVKEPSYTAHHARDASRRRERETGDPIADRIREAARVKAHWRHWGDEDVLRHFQFWHDDLGFPLEVILSEIAARRQAKDPKAYFSSPRYFDEVFECLARRGAVPDVDPDHAAKKAAEEKAAWEAEKAARAEAQREAERVAAEKKAAAEAAKAENRRIAATLRALVRDRVTGGGGSTSSGWDFPTIVMAHVREAQELHRVTADEVVAAVRWAVETTARSIGDPSTIPELVANYLKASSPEAEKKREETILGAFNKLSAGQPKAEKERVAAEFCASMADAKARGDRRALRGLKAAARWAGLKPERVMEVAS